MCSCTRLQITQELREYAQQHQIDEEQAAQVSQPLHPPSTCRGVSACLRPCCGALRCPICSPSHCVQCHRCKQCLERARNASPRLKANAVQAGMAEMSEQFKSVGAEVYLDEATVEATV